MKSIFVQCVLAAVSVLAAALAITASRREEPPPAVPPAPARTPPTPQRPRLEYASEATLDADWTCEGSITASMLQRVVASHADELAECDSATPAPLTELTLLLRVNREGRIERGHAVGSVPRGTRDCVVRAAAEWAFPPPTGGDCAVVRFPLAMKGQP